jgi:hypothetical protein
MKLVIAGHPVKGCSFHRPFPHGPDDNVSDIAEGAGRVLQGETGSIADLVAPGEDWNSDSHSGTPLLFPTARRTAVASRERRRPPMGSSRWIPAPLRSAAVKHQPTFVGSHTLTRTKYTPVALPNGGFDYRPDGQESATFDVYVDVPTLVKRIGWRAANSRHGETTLHRGAVVIRMRKD